MTHQIHRNKSKDSTPYKGFIFNKHDLFEFRLFLRRFEYAFVGRDCRHTRMFLVTKENDEGIRSAITLEVTRHGIEIPTTIPKWSVNGKPDLDTITTNWPRLLKWWLRKCNEQWIIIEP